MSKRRSLSMRIVLGVLIVILPVNVFMLLLAGTSQSVASDAVRASLSATAAMRARQLETRMESVSSFIWTLESDDANLKSINELEDWDRYYIAAKGLRHSMDQHLLSYGDADGFFFYSGNAGAGMADQLGIAPGEEAGYKAFILQPTVGGSFTGASGSTVTDYGTMESGWTARDGVLTGYRCVVPANTTATLYLPIDEARAERLSLPEGMTYLGMTAHNGADCAAFALLSGAYGLALD